jgi:uracil-DNA glycosylase family 4
MQNDLFDAAYNQILAAETYADFATRLRAYNCRRCQLCYARTNIVIDRGSPTAPVMMIGERPGDNEDLQGKPFVGRAGELLDKMLRAIQLDPAKDVIIANVTKCRPEVDRAPLADEVNACLPFLEKQVALVKPRVIVLLGAVALKWIDPERAEATMEEQAGKFFTISAYPGIQFMVMYNPAFLLRDPRKKPDAWEHLKALRDYLKAGAAAGTG